MSAIFKRWKFFFILHYKNAPILLALTIAPLALTGYELAARPKTLTLERAAWRELIGRHRAIDRELSRYDSTRLDSIARVEAKIGARTIASHERLGAWIESLGARAEELGFRFEWKLLDIRPIELTPELSEIELLVRLTPLLPELAYEGLARYLDDATNSKTAPIARARMLAARSDGRADSEGLSSAQIVFKIFSSIGPRDLSMGDREWSASDR